MSKVFEVVILSYYMTTRNSNSPKWPSDIWQEKKLNRQASRSSKKKTLASAAVTAQTDQLDGSIVGPLTTLHVWLPQHASAPQEWCQVKAYCCNLEGLLFHLSDQVKVSNLTWSPCPASYLVEKSKEQVHSHRSTRWRQLVQRNT